MTTHKGHSEFPESDKFKSRPARGHKSETMQHNESSEPKQSKAKRRFLVETGGGGSAVQRHNPQKSVRWVFVDTAVGIPIVIVVRLQEEDSKSWKQEHCQACPFVFTTATVGIPHPARAAQGRDREPRAQGKPTAPARCA